MKYFIGIYPEFVEYLKAVNEKTLKVYILLSKFRDKKNNTAYPSWFFLQKKLNIHKSSVQRAIKTLKVLGLIEITGRTPSSKKSYRGINVYKLLPPEKWYHLSNGWTLRDTYNLVKKVLNTEKELKEKAKKKIEQIKAERQVWWENSDRRRQKRR